MAVRYVADGSHFCNSGIFVASARTLLGEFERHAHDVLGAARAAFSGAGEDLHFQRLDAVALAKAPQHLPRLEKTSAAAMLALDVGWRDIASWSSL
jgi:mannose-1-phosphate guanylyltransferase/mannose-1-phosphate guanylyltransferase/mannose-6-phosphate isomerase